MQAAKEFNIDLAQSWMIGDSENDILAGKNAGCKVAFIGEGEYEKCYNNLMDFVSDNL